MELTLHEPRFKPETDELNCLTMKGTFGLCGDPVKDNNGYRNKHYLNQKRLLGYDV